MSVVVLIVGFCFGSQVIIRGFEIGVEFLKLVFYLVLEKKFECGVMNLPILHGPWGF